MNFLTMIMVTDMKFPTVDQALDIIRKWLATAVKYSANGLCRSVLQHAWSTSA